MRNNLSATECISEAWGLIKDEYLLFFGASTFGTFLLYLLPLLLQGPVYSGMYILLFAKMRGQRISFERFFDGFNHFLTSFLVTLITVLPGLILTIVITGFAILLIVSGSTLEEGGLSGALAGSIGILLLLVSVGVVIAISFQIMMGFAIPLVVEQGLGAVDACKRSAQAVMDNLGFVVVLVTLQTILMIAGTLACLVGILFVLPLVFASTAVAYRWIFGLNSTRQGAII